MTNPDLLSINSVADKLQLSVHQLRRWELMFGLEIKRGRGQQRQYRPEDLSVLERIKELVEQGWPTSQIRPQLEAEGLLSPKLIGIPPNPGNPEVLQESIIGLRNFTERRFIELSKQVDELRQLLISITLKQEIATDKTSPWQPVTTEYVATPKAPPPQEFNIGPQISLDPPSSKPPTPPPGFGPRPIIGASPSDLASSRNPLISPPAPAAEPPVRYGTIPPQPSNTEAAAGAAANAADQANIAQTASHLPMSLQAHPSIIQDEEPTLEKTVDSEAQKLEQDANTPRGENALASGFGSSAAQLTSEAKTASESRTTSEDRFAIPPLPPNPFKTEAPSQSASAGANAQSAAQAAISQDFLQNFAPASIPAPAPDFEDQADMETEAQLAKAEMTAEVEHVESGQLANLGPLEDTAEVAELAEVAEVEDHDEMTQGDMVEEAPAPAAPPPPMPIQAGPQVDFGPKVSAPTPQAQRVDDNFGLGEVTDQNYLTVLGRALDLIGWTDEQADGYSLKAFNVPHWDELGRSQAEKLVAHLVGLLKEQLG